MALRQFIPTRLQRLARSWSEQDTANSSPRRRGLSAGVSVAWWVEVMRAVAMWGLVDRTGMREICDLLAPGLGREGVRTESTMSWTPDKRAFVVARQLAREVFDKPAETQYRPVSKVLFFDCPASMMVPEMQHELPMERRRTEPAVQEIPMERRRSAPPATEQPGPGVQRFRRAVVHLAPILRRPQNVAAGGMSPSASSAVSTAASTPSSPDRWGDNSPVSPHSTRSVRTARSRQ